MDNKIKYKALLDRRDKLAQRLKHKYKGYRGVIHENALSELRHSEVKVLEAQLISLDEEIKILEEVLEKEG